MHAFCYIYALNMSIFTLLKNLTYKIIWTVFFQIKKIDKKHERDLKLEKVRYNHLLGATNQP